MTASLLWELITTVDDWHFRRSIPQLKGANDRVSRLLLLLITHPKEAAPDKLQLWRQLFPGQPFKSSNWDNLTSDALEQLYSYLSAQYFLEDEVEAGIWRSAFLQEAGLDKQANRQLRRTQKLLAKRPDRSFQYFRHNSQLASLEDQLALRQRRQRTEQLEMASDAFDLSYLINKLRLSCAKASRERAVSGGYQEKRLQYLLSAFKDELASPEEFPAVQLYHRLYKFLSLEHPKQEDYQAIKATVNAAAQFLPEEEERTVYKYLLNHCVGQINRGDQGYYPEVLQLYQLLLDRDLLIESGYLTPWSYSNIATAGLRQKAFVWTENFLLEYRYRLPAASQANAYQYNLASLEFERGDFDQALIALGSIAFTDAFYYISAKLIQLKIYYHQRDFAPLQSTAESARLYLLRNRQLSEYQRRSIRAFLRYIQQIAQWAKELPFKKPEVSAQRKQQLLQRIKEQQELAQRDWLLARLQEKA